MRMTRLTTTFALALMPWAAYAQQAQEAPQSPPSAPPAASSEDEIAEYVPPMKNVFDIGIRGSSFRGDSSRYERYRDIGNGAFMEQLRLHKETKSHWFLDAAGEHVGRLDQRLTGEIVKPGKLDVLLRWDQIPMLLSRTTQTLFTVSSPSVLTLDDTLQTQTQANAANLAKFVSSATQFDLKSRRYIGEGNVRFIATPDLIFKASFKHTDRSGAMPYGGSFGHGNTVETIAPVQHQLNDFDGGAEFMRGPVLVRAGYAASIFHNDYTSFTFDNPWRVTDIATASSRGRSSLPPSNSMYSVNGLAAFKFAGRSRVTAYVSAGSLKDAGDPIMAQTINSASATINALPRNTVQGEGKTSSVNLTFSSHPSRLVDVTARYRTYHYDNRTPAFDIFQRVSYDNAPAASATPIEIEPFGIKRSSLDADVRFTPQSALAVGVGYTNLTDERTHRIFEDTSENVTRVTVDSVGTAWLSLRTKYEHSTKRGTLNPEVFAEFSTIDQPGLRQFDIADRDRDRVTMLASVMPTETVAFNVSVAAGKDDYLHSLFGLRDNSHRVYSGGIDTSPGENVSFSVWYSYEKYASLSRSRQANPGVQQLDESRNWATDGNDKVHTIVASADFNKIAEKVDLRFSVDFSRSNSLYNYITGPVADRTLPEESTVLPSTLPTPSQLPETLSELARGTVDATYALSRHLAIGASYWYERYRVNDFSLDEQAISRLDLPGALLLGYAYRPYTANTVWGRVIYRF